jgi:predicted transcriptional regulator
MSSLTVRLTDREESDLQRACEQTGKTKSEVVRDLLAESLRGYRLRQALQKAHTELGGAARQAGWLTEEDILQDRS